MRKWLERLKNFIRYKDLLKHLVMRDIKLKYRRSILGYFWSVLDPLFSMIVMTIVFSTMFQRNIENFPLYLFCGQLLFNFMKNSTNQALHSINAGGALIKKTYVPKYIFTFSKIVSASVDLLFNTIALLIIMIVTGAKFSIYALFFPFIVLQVFVFCFGLGLFLAQANVFFKDVEHIYRVVLTMWLYLTPMFYPMEALPDNVRWGIEHFNPMYYYIKQFRDIIYIGTAPQIEYSIAGCIAALVVLCFGTAMFLKNQDKFILYI